MSNFFQSTVWLICPLFLFIATSCDADEEKNNIQIIRENIQYLKTLELGDLSDVEVVLDDVFDIFDALLIEKNVSVATGYQQKMASAPAVTNVVTAMDIEAIGATDIDEILETIPGLHVARRNYGYNPIYTMRGIYNDFNPQILMLINNIPITVLSTGNRGTIWGGMPVNNIAYIEIIRGPGSAIYGANAFAGVINVITKTNKDIKGTEVGARIGSFSTEDAWLLHGDTWLGFDIAVALEYHDTHGQREIIETDAQTAFDNLFDTHASLAPGSVNLQRHNLDARIDLSKDDWQFRAGYQGRRNWGVGAGDAQALDPIGRFQADRFNIDLTYHNPKITENWDMTAQMSFFNSTDDLDDSNQILFPPGAFGGSYPEGYIGNPGVSENIIRFDLSGIYSGIDDHMLRVGIGYNLANVYKVTHIANFGVDPNTHEELPPGNPLIDASDTPYAFLPEKSRKNSYIFLQDSWQFALNWEFTAGLRYDDYSDFGDRTSPRLALVWKTTPDLTTKLLYGNAFRAPVLSELYNVNNPVALGNPNLKPEVIETTELVFDYRITSTFNLATNLFYYNWRDRIIYQPDPATDTFTATNAGEQQGYGIEWEGRWKATKNFSLLLNYAIQHATDEQDHKIPNAPGQEAYLRADWLMIPNWYLDTQINWIADRTRTFGDPRSVIDDDTTLDITLRYKDIRQGRWNFALGIRNILDVDTYEPSQGPDSFGLISIPNDLPLAGRNYFLELRYRF